MTQVTSSQMSQDQLDPQFFGAIASALIPIAVKHGPDIAKQVLAMFTTEPPGNVR